MLQQGICHANSSVTVSLENITKKVSLPRDVADGNHAPIDCNIVNPSFVGTIWLNCTGGELTPDVGQCLPSGLSSAECEQEKVTLEELYVKTYVELARLVSEYDDLANSTACVDLETASYNNRRAPLSTKGDELTEKIS